MSDTTALLGPIAVAADEAAADEIEWVQALLDMGGAVWLVPAAALAVWFAFIQLHAWRVRPRRVRSGPETFDLPGDEPPALVNLLTNSWTVEHEAVPATLLDLAARGQVSIRQHPEGLVVHVPEGEDEGTLLPYERQVLLHARRLADGASGGNIPVAALTTGPDDDSKRWWREFVAAVEQDATDRGFARKRWSGRRLLVLGLVAAAPAFAFGLALGATVAPYNGGSTDSDVIKVGAFYGFFAWVGLCGFVIGSLSGVTDTPAGREAAARWLGLRGSLVSDPRFAEQTPSTVDVWGRKLAYGAAMGLARGAVHGIPMGAENDREVWSNVGGSWRVVHVRYPKRFLGNDIHPVVSIVVGVGAAWLGAPLPLGMLSMLSGDDGLDDLRFVFAVLLVTGPFLLFGVAGVRLVLAGLLDLVIRRKVVEGEVLRVQEKSSSSWWVIVDDGKSSHIRAWSFSERPDFRVGGRVRAEVTRYLGHRRNFEVLATDEPTEAFRRGSAPTG